MSVPKDKILKRCEFCGSEFTTVFEWQKYCCRNCTASATYHRAHPDAKIVGFMNKGYKCEMENCKFYSDGYKNRCSVLTATPLRNCNFYKEKQEKQNGK